MEERPAVRYLMAYLIGGKVSGELRLTTIEWPVDEERALRYKRIGWWVMADPDDVIVRDLFDMRLAEERKWDRLFNKRRHD